MFAFFSEQKNIYVHIICPLPQNIFFIFLSSIWFALFILYTVWYWYNKSKNGYNTLFIMKAISMKVMYSQLFTQICKLKKLLCFVSLPCVLWKKNLPKKYQLKGNTLKTVTYFETSLKIISSPLYERSQIIQPKFGF